MIYPAIEEFLASLKPAEIAANRQNLLQPLITYIKNTRAKGLDVRLIFICTHNSRRSHLAQIWAQTIVRKFDLCNIWCYSGGTEATALNDRVAEMLQSSGMQVQVLSEGDNPVYSIKHGESAHPIIGFSKRFDHAFNPASSFAAVMTCAAADNDCPMVAGAEARIPITYEDPKLFDGTPYEAEKYSKCSRQIATEMFYVFSQI